MEILRKIKTCRTVSVFKVPGRLHRIPPRQPQFADRLSCLELGCDWREAQAVADTCAGPQAAKPWASRGH